MYKLVGSLLILNSLVITAWWVMGEHTHKGWAYAICLVALFAGIFLVLQERVTELTVEGIGAIKSAAEKANTDANAISELRNRVEAQSATVDLIAQSASKARETAEKAEGVLKELEVSNDFMLTVVAARNDDREAFERLRAWQRDKSNKFRDAAIDAVIKIRGEYHGPIQPKHPIFPQAGISVDTSQTSISYWREAHASAPRMFQAGLVKFVWRNDNIPKTERMKFLADIIRRDPALANEWSLTSLYYVGELFAEEVGIKWNAFDIEQLLEWWEKNKDSLE